MAPVTIITLDGCDSMMRCGKGIGTLNWKTKVIPTMGSEKGWITESIRKEIMQEKGISKRHLTK